VRLAHRGEEDRIMTPAFLIRTRFTSPELAETRCTDAVRRGREKGKPQGRRRTS
jgi:hypothetical protein